MTQATKRDIKSDAPVSRPMTSFAFGRQNYMFLLIGVACLVLGYITLSGGGSTDPNVFSEELFSPRRMVVAPIILIIGYGIVAYAIMLRPKKEDEPQAPQE
jgi:Protein of unknown function (DUF3098)